MTDFLSDSAQNAAQRGRKWKSNEERVRERERERSSIVYHAISPAFTSRRIVRDSVQFTRTPLSVFHTGHRIPSSDQHTDTPYYSANVITIASTTCVTITIIKLTCISFSWYCSSRKFVTIPPQRDANKRTRRRNFYSKKRITPIFDTETTKIPDIFDIVIS